MNEYQYILLDWDGNLAKTLDVWLQATRIPLEKRGVYLTDQEIGVQILGRTHAGLDEYGIQDADEFLKEMDAIAAQLLPDVELYPDAIYVLEELRNKGKKTALITSNWRRNVILLLDKYNIHHLFDYVIAGDEVTHHKPHPEPLFKALAELGAEPADAIMIGDSDKDIAAANNAGVDSILFYPDEHKKFYHLDDLQKHKPTYKIDDFRRVIDIVGA